MYDAFRNWNGAGFTRDQTPFLYFVWKGKEQEEKMIERKKLYFGFIGLRLFYGSLLLDIFYFLSFLIYFYYFLSLYDEKFGMIGTKVDPDDEDNAMASLRLLN